MRAWIGVLIEQRRATPPNQRSVMARARRRRERIDRARSKLAAAKPYPRYVRQASPPSPRPLRDLDIELTRVADIFRRGVMLY